MFNVGTENVFENQVCFLIHVNNTSKIIFFNTLFDSTRHSQF